MLSTASSTIPTAKFIGQYLVQFPFNFIVVHKSVKTSVIVFIWGLSLWATTIPCPSTLFPFHHPLPLLLLLLPEVNSWIVIVVVQWASDEMCFSFFFGAWISDSFHDQPLALSILIICTLTLSDERRYWHLTNGPRRIYDARSGCLIFSGLESSEVAKKDDPQWYFHFVAVGSFLRRDTSIFLNCIIVLKREKRYKRWLKRCKSLNHQVVNHYPGIFSVQMGSETWRMPLLLYPFFWIHWRIVVG